MGLIQWKPTIDQSSFGLGIVQAAQQIAANVSDNWNTTKFPYDFANTYPSYQIPRTLDSIVSLSDLADFVWTNRTILTQDLKTISNGNIIVDQNWLYIQTYQISQRYKLTAIYNDSFTETLVLTADLR